MGFIGYLIFGLSQMLPAQANLPRAPADSGFAAASTPARDKLDSGDRAFPWFVILSSPPDIAALWQSIEHPDLVVIKESQLANKEARDVLSNPDRAHALRWVVESVMVRGRLGEEFADLVVDLAIKVKGTDPLWVPIRLDGRTLTRARQASLDLALRRIDRAQWEVKLEGEGDHRVLVELRTPYSAAAARKSLSLAIPEAASTAVDLEFSHGESDIVIGANEAFGLHDGASGKEARLTAHLSPRSALDMSWTANADAGAANPPLLTAQGEIAIDIDDDQVRTRSSWAIRCLRGATRSLELQMDDDEVTELTIDDQSAESGVERVRGTGKLMVRLANPLRTGATLRLVMKTRRPLVGAGARSVSFAGFPFATAREQSGFIGITQSANLWVKAATSRGLRQVDISKLPAELRTRPATSLAFEFLDQPFLLDLGVEPSPPLVKSDSKTIFRIAPERARSETTIELGWVRGRLSEVELGVAPGLELISVGPAEVVESSHMSDLSAATDPGGAASRDRRLRIRLTSASRDANKVTLKLTGVQRIGPEHKVKLGLFAPIQASASHALVEIHADRGLAIALADGSGRIRISSELLPAAGKLAVAGPEDALRGALDSSPLLLVDDDNSRYLEVNITRQARTLVQETVLSAQVSRKWVDLLERSTFGVRHGVLVSLEMLVPAEIVDRWELLDKELVDREETGQEAGGARRYRLKFARPVVDKVTLRFRYRLGLAPPLDATTAHEVTIPSISFREVPPGPTRVEISLAPDIILNETSDGWIRSAEDAHVEPFGEGAILSFTESDAGARGRAFRFHALALEPVPLPTLVVPRLLLKTVSGDDDSVRTSATYWVESHGPDFTFALPDGARWVGAKVDGKVAEQVDYNPAVAGYRLRFPAEVASRSVLVELQYEQGARGVAPTWRAPRLLDGGALLQTLWELRLPSSLALVGVPRGWSDENHWAWSDFMWKRRPWQNMTAVNDWIGGALAVSRTAEEFDGASPYNSDRYLFSRSGPPAALSVWVVSRSWLVAICSGATLFIGFLCIFSHLRIRTAWIIIAVLALLAAILAPPSVVFLALESGLLGVVLILVGLVIELLIDRTRSRSVRARPVVIGASRSVADSSLNLRPRVGSDDSTAIRVRPSSTLDFVPAQIPAQEVLDDPLTPSLEST